MKTNSKISKVVCAGQEFSVEEFNGTVYLKQQSTASDFRGNKIVHPVNLLFGISPEEASYVAQALLAAAGKPNTLAPTEKVNADAPTLVSDSTASEEKAPTT